MTDRLPAPQLTGKLSLEEALARRRSVREFRPDPLREPQMAQLLWAAQGVTGEGGRRTAPSAGALYPLEVYALTPEGLYHYHPHEHALSLVHSGDLRRRLYEASLNQEMLLQAPLTVVLAAVYWRVTGKYGRARGPRYVHFEVGHAAQNLLLQATAIGLGAVPVGAFRDDAVKAMLDLPADHEPLLLIPVGYPR